MTAGGRPRRARPLPAPVRTAVRLALLPVALAAPVLAGCAGARASRPGAAVPIADDAARALVSHWEEARQQFTGLRAAAEVIVHTPKRDDRASALLLLSPTALRLEVATPFGLPALVATAGPDRVVVFRPLERRATTARPTPEAIQRWLGVPVGPEVLIGLLAGFVPSPDPDTLRTLGGADAHLAYEHGGIGHRVWVAASGYPLRLAIDRRPGAPVLYATIDWTIDGHVQRVTIEATEKESLVSVRYMSAEPAAPPPEAFVLTLPADVRTEAFD